jgi:hypothetical protein
VTSVEQPGGAAVREVSVLVKRAKCIRKCHVFAYDRGGTLWMADWAKRSAIWRLSPSDMEPRCIAEIDGFPSRLCVSPDGAHAAVTACRQAFDGVVSTGTPHDVWLVSLTAEPRKLLDSAASPFGVEWSPEGDRLAVGGVFGKPRLRLVDLDGIVVDEPSLRRGTSPWVDAWTADGVLLSAQLDDDNDDDDDDDDALDELLIYRPAARFWQRRWHRPRRRWWPSPCRRTAVSSDRRQLIVRGMAFGRWPNPDPAWVNKLADEAPSWAGPYRIVRNGVVLDLRTWERRPFTSATRNVFNLSADADGKRLAWHDNDQQLWCNVDPIEADDQELRA